MPLSRIALTAIVRNEHQPRQFFDAAKLAELADSIEENGCLQEPTVRPLGNGTYEIVAGERRFRAHQILAARGAVCRKTGKGFDTMLVNIKSMSVEDRDVAAIIENLQRADVLPMEEARAFHRMASEYGLEPAAIAKRLGVSQLKVKWRLSLMNLCPEGVKLLEAGQIEQQAANEIARLGCHRDQVRMIQLINSGKIKGGWKSIRSAIDAMNAKDDQNDMFGASAPVASDADVATVTRMEKKIQDVVSMIASGFKDGECVVAAKVSRDRAGSMADLIAQAKKALSTMERDLRMSLNQGALFVADVA